MRLAIIGLLPRQERTVQSAFPNADLRFIETACRTRMGKADHIIVMTKFFNHSRGQALLNGISRQRITLVHQGMTVLLETIRNLLGVQMTR